MLLNLHNCPQNTITLSLSLNNTFKVHSILQICLHHVIKSSELSSKYNNTLFKSYL